MQLNLLTYLYITHFPNVYKISLLSYNLFIYIHVPTNANTYFNSIQTQFWGWISFNEILYLETKNIREFIPIWKKEQS